jgi:NADPH-dependent ferric siderophore reductase
VERVRHETRRRKLVVARTERLPANLVRIVFKGEELEGFTSLGFDDHIKVFFPAIQGNSAPAMRDFTPRHYDLKAGELWVDFYLHDAGPAAAWAAQATVGQTLEIGGPRGSMVVALEGIDAHVFIGDETALPAISRRLEELPPRMPTLVVAEIDAASTKPSLPSRAAMEVICVARDGRAESPAHEIINTLRKLEFPPGRCFVWVAVESQAARAIRNYLRNERGLDKNWIKAAGYWQRGTAGEHERIDD